MKTVLRQLVAGAATVTLAGLPSSEASAGKRQDEALSELVCGQRVPEPARLPPDGSGPVVYLLALCFSTQGNVSFIDPETYLHHVVLRPSRPSMNDWVPYDDRVEETIREDFWRLWSTGFLDDLRIEAADHRFANGVVGRVVTYHMEERPRVRSITYQGSRRLDRGRLEEQLRERGLALRPDAFLDDLAVRRIEAVTREVLADQGFVNASVTHTVEPVAGAAQVVHVTFHVDDGPRVAIRDVAFVGNLTVRDGTLLRVLRDTRPMGVLSFATGSGYYREANYAADALRLEEYYRNHGYLRARVGLPELRWLYDSEDGGTQWVQVRIPISEGPQYRLRSVAFDGNRAVGSPALHRLLGLREGELYSEQQVREGLERAQSVYGAAGYLEFTAFPDLALSDEDGGPAAATATPAPDGEDAPHVDLTFRVEEGAQYTVNRIEFRGHTTTRDEVIRREMGIVEGGVFDAELLKYSLRRLNQLGYFKPLEGDERDLQVEKATAQPDAVDITLILEEQNRNQLTFGAGMSQYDEVSGNLAFTTTNFMGRGESLTLSAQKSVRTGIYQLSFTRPYLFSHPVSGGVNLFSTKVDYLASTGEVGYSEVRQGGGLTVGRPILRFSRIFLTYAYEVVDTAASRDFLRDVASPLTDGRHTESRVRPSFLHSTVDNPYLPRRGLKVEVDLPLVGGPLGGTTHYVRPEVEAILYLPHTRRTTLGLRAGAGWIRPFGDTRTLPYYLRFHLGGEYQIRGVDVRSVGPVDAEGRMLGGNKFALFNAEYSFDVGGPVRALLFHDAGQAFREGHAIDLRQMRTSSGLELRVIVPMLNLPFRVIQAWNVYRDPSQPARTLKFAVGTTF